jgi:hypothetical protein
MKFDILAENIIPKIHKQILPSSCPAGSYAFLGSLFPLFEKFFRTSSGMLIHCASYFTFSGHHKPARLTKCSHSSHLVTLHSTKSFNKSCTFFPRYFITHFGILKCSNALASHSRTSITSLPTIQVTYTVHQWHTQFRKIGQYVQKLQWKTHHADSISPPPPPRGRGRQIYYIHTRHQYVVSC